MKKRVAHLAQIPQAQRDNSSRYSENPGRPSDLSPEKIQIHRFF